jgi:hypothetical protein
MIINSPTPSVSSDDHDDQNEQPSVDTSEESWIPNTSDESVSHNESGSSLPLKNSPKSANQSTRIDHSEVNTFDRVIETRSISVISVSSSSETGGGEERVDVDMNTGHPEVSEHSDSNANCQNEYENENKNNVSIAPTSNNHSFQDNSIFGSTIRYEIFNAQNGSSTHPSSNSTTTSSSTSDHSTSNHTRSSVETEDDMLRIQTPHTPSLSLPTIVEQNVNGRGSESSQTPQTEQVLDFKPQVPPCVAETEPKSSWGDTGMVQSVERCGPMTGKDERNVVQVDEETEPIIEMSQEHETMSMELDNVVGADAGKDVRMDSEFPLTHNGLMVTGMTASAENTPPSDSESASFLTWFENCYELTVHRHQLQHLPTSLIFTPPPTPPSLLTSSYQL